MASKKSTGTVKVHRTRKPQVFFAVYKDGKIEQTTKDLLKTAAESGTFANIVSVWNAKPVMVRRVEVIKFGNARKPKPTEAAPASK